MKDGESTIEVKRRVLILLIILPLFSSIAPLTNMLDNPRFRNIRGIDVVRLLTIGVCWGVALVALCLLITSKLRARSVSRAAVTDPR